MLRLLLAQDAAVQRVGDRLSRAAGRLCRTRGWVTGIGVTTLSQYGIDYRLAARDAIGLSGWPMVSVVVPGSPADHAALMVGDEIRAIDGQQIEPLPSGGGRATTDDTEKALDAIDAAIADGKMTLALWRSGRDLAISIAGVPACSVRFEVRTGSATNAYAGRARVQISSDLVDLAREDSVIAPLLAHELAHIVLRHDDALLGKRDGLLPGFGRHGDALRASELAADRLGVHLLSMAGYRPADAIAMRLTVAKRKHRGLLSDRTHPPPDVRLSAIRAEIVRADAIRAAGGPILPPSDLLVTPYQ